jgi:hypothetical protein
MKRIDALTVVLVILLSCVDASAASLRHQLLAAREVPGWAKYYVAAADTRSPWPRFTLTELNARQFKTTLRDALARFS